MEPTIDLRQEVEKPCLGLNIQHIVRVGLSTKSICWSIGASLFQKASKVSFWEALFEICMILGWPLGSTWAPFGLLEAVLKSKCFAVDV